MTSQQTVRSELVPVHDGQEISEKLSCRLRVARTETAHALVLPPATLVRRVDLSSGSLAHSRAGPLLGDADCPAVALNKEPAAAECAHHPVNVGVDDNTLADEVGVGHRAEGHHGILPLPVLGGGPAYRRERVQHRASDSMALHRPETASQAALSGSPASSGGAAPDALQGRAGAAGRGALHRGACRRAREVRQHASSVAAAAGAARDLTLKGCVTNEHSVQADLMHRAAFGRDQQPSDGHLPYNAAHAGEDDDALTRDLG